MVVVHATDNTRLDLIIPGEQHFYVKALTPRERQEWLVALGSAKASKGNLTDEQGLFILVYFTIYMFCCKKLKKLSECFQLYTNDSVFLLVQIPWALWCTFCNLIPHFFLDHFRWSDKQVFDMSNGHKI